MQTDNDTEQLKKEFQFTLSKFSHEIRNPIALISSELQLLAVSHPELTTYKNWDDVMDNLDYIRDLLNELSDYNNAGRLSKKPVNLSLFLTRILATVQPTVHYLGIRLENQISPCLPVMSIDTLKMRQALLNLLRNAQEAISHDHGIIIFRAYQAGTQVCISIEDNGCGIPARQLQEIFSPFVTFKTSGSGLGLAVTRQIIQAHHGEIQVNSTPGKGSVFQIFLG